MASASETRATRRKPATRTAPAAEPEELQEVAQAKTSTATTTEATELPSLKHSWIAYILYFFGGTLGLHHLYLDRPDHAFLWLTTFGGWGFGCIRDLWRIPSYVAAANADEKFLQDYRAKLQYNTARGVYGADGLWESFQSVIGMIFVGVWFRYVAINALPRVQVEEEYPVPFTIVAGLVGLVGTTMGVVTAGTLPFGMVGSWRQAFSGAVVGELLFGDLSVGLGFRDEVLSEDPDDPGFSSGLIPVFIAMLWFLRSRRYLTLAQLVDRESDSSFFKGGSVANYTILEPQIPTDPQEKSEVVSEKVVSEKLRRTRRKQSKERGWMGWNLLRVFFFTSVFWGVAMHGAYHNVRVHSDGEDITLREAATNFFDSPAWAQSKSVMGGLFNTWWEKGYTTMQEEMFEKFDLGGTKRAYVDLELEETATREEIKQAARRLGKLYHPDRCTEGSPEYCVDKFQRVQRAKEKLLAPTRGQ